MYMQICMYMNGKFLYRRQPLKLTAYGSLNKYKNDYFPTMYVCSLLTFLPQVYLFFNFLFIYLHTYYVYIYVSVKLKILN